MAVAAATVPTSGAQTSVGAYHPDPVAIHDPLEVRPAAGIEGPLPLLLVQSTAPPRSTVPAQQTDPASPAPPTQAPVPAPAPGEIVVTGRRASPDDPLEKINAQSYEVVQSVDKAIVAPLAFAYEDIMPRPIRKGLRNFLHNLGEPVVFLNFMLQLKPGKAAETLGRFVINSTIGVAGLVDVAKRKPFNLPRRRNGFANTLGYYGVPQGPYFYLPLIGPTTLRDFIGNRLDLLVLPIGIGKQFSRPEYALPVAALSELNSRIEFDDELRQIRATRDPYVAARSYYLRKRQAEIDALHGRGDGTVPITLPAPASSNAAPAQDPPAKR
jgi:phospholipid-binding lipoprotein MlaA